jgi:hypothetical protein
MIDQVRFHPDLPSDLADAIRWYDHISPELGNRFRNAVRSAFDKVRKQPLLYGCLFEDVRGIRVEAFPYLVQYCMKGDVTFILGLFHTSSNPDRWKDRAR